MAMKVPPLTLRTHVLCGDEPVWLQRHPRRAYVRQLIIATPPWARRSEVIRLERLAQQRSRSWGCLWVVDHVIPLNHPMVCGLNWHGNMRVITERENQMKGNRWPENLELFDKPEQLRMFR